MGLLGCQFRRGLEWRVKTRGACGGGSGVGGGGCGVCGLWCVWEREDIDCLFYNVMQAGREQQLNNPTVSLSLKSGETLVEKKKNGFRTDAQALRQQLGPKSRGNQRAQQHRGHPTKIR